MKKMSFRGRNVFINMFQEPSLFRLLIIHFLYILYTFWKESEFNTIVVLTKILKPVNFFHGATSTFVFWTISQQTVLIISPKLRLPGNSHSSCRKSAHYQHKEERKGGMNFCTKFSQPQRKIIYKINSPLSIL